MAELKLNEATMKRLRQAQADALLERRGLIAGTDKDYVSEPVKRWGEFIEAKSPITAEPDEARRGLIARLLDHQFMFMEAVTRSGQFKQNFRIENNLEHLWYTKRQLAETTNSGDIATFTQQVIAFLLPVFERIMIDNLIHMRAMQGPTAYVHTLDYLIGTAGGAYAAGESFQGRLDIDYSDCPTECNDANEVDLTLTSTTVTAVCKRLMAKWCLPAQQDYRSQHSRSIGDDVRGMMQLEMMREKQGEVLQELVAGAGYSATWSSTIPVGSVYNTLDPRAYARTLYDAVLDANNGIFTSNDGYRAANWMAGDPDTLTRLEKLKEFTFTARDNVPRSAAGTGTIDEYGAFFGVANNRYNVWKFPFMTANTLLLGVKSDEPQALGFLHCEYIPLFDLGIWLDPASGEYRTGMQTRYANVLLRPGLYAKITVT